MKGEEEEEEEKKKKKKRKNENKDENLLVLDTTTAEKEEKRGRTTENRKRCFQSRGAGDDVSNQEAVHAGERRRRPEYRFWYGGFFEQ